MKTTQLTSILHVLLFIPESAGIRDQNFLIRMRRSRTRMAVKLVAEQEAVKSWGDLCANSSLPG